MRQISKIKQYNAIEERHVRARGRFSKTKHPGGTYFVDVKKAKKNDADANKISTPYNLIVERASEKFS